ncbi:MAG: alpha-ribazole phosphatase [Acidaminococcales bacterium]|jgi:alpha-ribazole phosphatase|nr:alpha-ribazole phosphatase [Acidaminococcales bacterium]
MRNIYLIRHGETNWNSARRLQGATDVELSEKGLRQAQKLAQRLAGNKFAAIYASDLKRAAVTAGLIAEKHNLAVVLEPLFREMAFGEWEGLDIDAINEKWPGQLKNLFENTNGFKIPGGEGFDNLRRRVATAFQALADRHADPEENIAVVAHGGTIRAILGNALDIQAAGVWRFQLDNAGISILSAFGGRFSISLLNDTNHLC